MDTITSDNSSDKLFDALRLNIASSDQVMQWSNGEVTKSETINYRTQKPERDGLFCEKIFGPSRDINRNDNKFKGIRARDVAVDRKGEIVTRSIARRERMAHISLAAPVTHIWFLRGTPSPLSQIFGMTVKSLEKVIYFASYIVMEVDEDKRQEALVALQAEADLAKAAINKRFEDASGEKDADVKALIEVRNNELEESAADYLIKKEMLQRLQLHSLVSEHEYGEMPSEYRSLVKVGMGAQSILQILSSIDIDELIADLEKKVDESSGQNKKKNAKRLKMASSFKTSGNSLTSMVMTVVPVIPPDLRPMIQLAGGRFATSDLNDLYRRVINRNNRLKKLMDLGAPEIICRNEKRMLQESVDALIDNNSSRGNRSVTGAGGRRRLKSLADMLKGKQGRFRQNLLGKRVDYSARSVIVSGPELDVDECGMPKTMALELFKPFVIGELMANGRAYNIKSAQKLIDDSSHYVWDALDEVVRGKYVLLNRAPTLHRLGIQAFRPRLIEGKALQLHPLFCGGFNADFDGDQMAVHLPLSDLAQAEARDIMAASKNLLKPADGDPVLYLEQDIILGAYYMTMDPAKDSGRAFSSLAEAILARDNGQIDVHDGIKVYMSDGEYYTTIGRMLFNEALPEGYSYQNVAFAKKRLKGLMADIYRIYGQEVTAEVANEIKQLGFAYATKSGLTTAIGDYSKLEGIDDIFAESDKKAAAVSDQFDSGLMSDEERYRATVNVWKENDEKIQTALQEQFDKETTSTAIFVVSGARGNISSVKQIAASLGVTADVTGRDIELPIKSNYREGLSPLESFVATRGGRKGLVSTALRTADSGYLTRRLVDVAQDVFTVDIEEEDPGFAVRRSESEKIGFDFADRIAGRYLARDVEVDGEVIAEAATLIDPFLANQIAETGVEEVYIRSVLTSSNSFGVSQMSYGVDPSTGLPVELKTPVGVIAAQSIGEPGTQLTLNVFHAGGVAGTDINQGLPRVDEILEARAPKGEAIVAELAGEARVFEEEGVRVVEISGVDVITEEYPLKDRVSKVKDGAKVKKGDVIAEAADDEKSIVAAGIEGVATVDDEKISIRFEREVKTRYEIPSGKQIIVVDGDRLEKGDRITAGSLELKKLMANKGVEATQRYIINEVLSIYLSQGEDVDDKHLEIIINQMFSRVQIDDPGDSNYVTNQIVSRHSVMSANKKLTEDGKKPIEYTRLVLGITKVGVTSDSWLSAASFQNTNRVLISAAVNGQDDYLGGLKENVIIGGKIPVGTGAIETH